MEHKILASILKSRKAWEALKDTLDRENLSPEGSVIERLVGEYYSLDPEAQGCDPDLLCARVEREVQSNKHQELIVQAVKGLASMDVSAVNVVAEQAALQKQVLGNKLAAKLASGAKDDQAIRQLMEEYIRAGDDVPREARDDILVGTSAADLTAKAFTKEGLIQLYPKVLNDQIDGGIRGGHHILVFAPTEMGKTLVAINMCYGFLKQGKKVLYVGNEDGPSDILMRMMTRLTGMTKYEIIEKPKEADEILSRRNWDKFIFANLAPGTFPRIRSEIESIKPDVLVLDQLRNLDVNSENRTHGLEKAATEARNIAKKYNIPVISVTQAADSASGKKILNRGDVDGSNVGIPGQMDLMIGFGADQDMEENDMRMFSFAKNKLSGRHAPIPVNINPLLSMVVE